MPLCEVDEKVLSGVPDYRVFLTVDELNRRSEDLASRYPHTVELVSLGHSRSGDPIRALRIGEGRAAALLFGCPHPNEPIGSLMLDYLAERLAADEEFRLGLGYTWFIIKCIDPDGTRLNEGWFKRPFDIETYVRNYYRPPGFQQVEWTFPVDYEGLHFNSPLPEARCLMTIIQQEKPRLLYSLHNTSFGGAYWYIAEGIPELYPSFHGLARRYGVPLALGEAEVPYCQRLAPAIYRSFGIKDSYDFYSRHGRDPAEVISGGAGSCEYAREVAGTFALVCEVPYYHDRRIQDMRQSDRTRRETILEGLEISRESWRFIGDEFSRLKALLPDITSPLEVAIDDSIWRHFIAIEAEWHWASTDRSLLRPATKAEAFDSLLLTRFQDLLTVGMLWRLAREALTGIQDRETKDAVEGIERRLGSRISAESAWLEDTLDYDIVPIRDLIRIQLGSGLLLARHLASRETNHHAQAPHASGATHGTATYGTAHGTACY